MERVRRERLFIPCHRATFRGKRIQTAGAAPFTHVRTKEATQPYYSQGPGALSLTHVPPFLRMQADEDIKMCVGSRTGKPLASCHKWKGEKAFFGFILSFRDRDSSLRRVGRLGRVEGLGSTVAGAGQGDSGASLLGQCNMKPAPCSSSSRAYC